MVLQKPASFVSHHISYLLFFGHFPAVVLGLWVKNNWELVYPIIFSSLILRKRTRKKWSQSPEVHGSIPESSVGLITAVDEKTK